MKNISKWHTRNAPILDHNALVLEVCNIDHAIDIMESILTGIETVESVFGHEYSVNYRTREEKPVFRDLPDFGQSIQSLSVGFVRKAGAFQRDVYLVKVLPSQRTGKTVIFDERDLPKVLTRIRSYIDRLKEEKATGQHDSTGTHR